MVLIAIVKCNNSQGICDKENAGSSTRNLAWTEETLLGQNILKLEKLRPDISIFR
jgi:hypothetical protein